MRVLLITMIISSVQGIKVKTPTDGKVGSIEVKIHNAYKGHLQDEEQAGKNDIKEGHVSLEKGVSELENIIKDDEQELQERKESLRKFQREAEKMNLQEIQKGTTSQDASKKSFKQLKESFMRHIAKKDNETKREIASLAETTAGMQKASRGMFEVADSSQMTKFMAKFEPAGINILKDQKFLGSFAGGGCLATIVAHGAIPIAETLRANSYFFELQVGSSGGFWSLLQDLLAYQSGDQTGHAEGDLFYTQMATKCSLLDKNIGYLPPKERSRKMIDCLGCKGLDYKECHEHLKKITPEDKSALFGPCQGCVQDRTTWKRVLKIPGLCIQYQRKYGRPCSFLNLGEGLVTAILPPNHDVPVSVTIDVPTPEDNGRRNKEGKKMRLPTVGFAAATATYSTKKVSPIDFATAPLNDTIPDASGSSYKLSYWERLFVGSQSINAIRLIGGGSLYLEELTRMATMTSAMPGTTVMSVDFLINTGICKAAPGKKLDAKGLVGRLLMPLAELFVNASQSDLTSNLIKMFQHMPFAKNSQVWDGWQYMLDKDGLYTMYPNFDAIVKGSVSQGPKKLACFYKSVEEYMKPSRLGGDASELANYDIGDDVGAQKVDTTFQDMGHAGASDTYLFDLPCAFEDASLTSTIFRDFLMPMTYMLPQNLADWKYNQGVSAEMSTEVVGDAGMADSLSLGTALTQLFKQGGMRGAEWAKFKARSSHWHIFALNTRPTSTEGDQTWYHTEYAKIRTHFGTIMSRMEEAGADCSASDTVVKNANYIFDVKSDLGGISLKEGSLATTFSNAECVTRSNDRWGIQGGEPFTLSVRSLNEANSGLFKGFLATIPKDYSDALAKAGFPEFLVKGIDVTAVRARQMMFGIDDPFAAFALKHFGELLVVDWLCALVMAPEDCTVDGPVYENPLAFLQALQKLTDIGHDGEYRIE